MRTTLGYGLLMAAAVAVAVPARARAPEEMPVGPGTALESWLQAQGLLKKQDG